MSTMLKYLMISAIVALGLLGILLMARELMLGHHHEMYKNAGKGFDEKLEESKKALDKATAHIMSVFEHLKDQKA